MTMQLFELPSHLTSPDLDPALRRQVVRRANLLCLRAEPHTAQAPCAAHLNEANRQVLYSLV